MKGNQRRIKHPSNRLAAPAPTVEALDCLTATAAGVTICRPPTRPGIRCAGSPTMAGRAARPGGCIPACDRHQAGSSGGWIWPDPAPPLQLLAAPPGRRSPGPSRAAAPGRAAWAGGCQKVGDRRPLDRSSLFSRSAAKWIGGRGSQKSRPMPCRTGRLASVLWEAKNTPPGGQRYLGGRSDSSKPGGTVGTVGTQAGNPSGARLSGGLCCSHSQFT